MIWAGVEVIVVLPAMDIVREEVVSTPLAAILISETPLLSMPVGRVVVVLT